MSKVIYQLNILMVFFCLVIIVEDYNLLSWKIILSSFFLIILLISTKTCIACLLIPLVVGPLLLRLIFVKTLIYDYKEEVRFIFTDNYHFLFFFSIAFFLVIKLLNIIRNRIFIVVKIKLVISIFSSWLIFSLLYIMRPRVYEAIWHFQPYGSIVYMYSSISFYYILFCSFFLLILPAVYISRFVIIEIKSKLKKY